MYLRLFCPSLLFLILLPGLSMAAGPPVLDDGRPSEADLALRERLQTRLDEIAADQEKYREALYTGELRATLCKTCHGPDGNSVRDGTPNLAGQDPIYIVDQFNRYADGRRADFWMASLAKSFGDEDKIMLAVFYSAQRTRAAGGGDSKLLDHGQRLYRSHCVECHGEDGRNRKGFARLAGQRPEYTRKMLREFRSAAGRRFNPLMYARANMLKSDRDIDAVATYLAHLD